MFFIDNTGDMEQIYKQHAQTVYRFLLSLSGNAGTAEELTQETFYRAIYSIKNYNGNCKISVWLCQIAKHVWYQELEKNSKAKYQELPETLPDKPPTPEEALFVSQDKIALYTAIHSLEPPARDVVHLRLTGEFSFAEIGQVLQKTENWARVTFYRAKQKLIKEMEK